VKQAKGLWKEFEAWLVAYERGDLDEVMALFDRDVVYSIQGLPDAGYDDLRRVYSRSFRKNEARPGTKWVAVPEEVYAEGKLATVRGRWELHTPDGKGGVKVTERNRGMDLFKRTRSGWKLIRSVNYPEH
jgi:ketosteroid isomerase-like protein